MKTQLAGLRAATQTCGGCQGPRGPAVPNVNTTDRRHTRSKGHGRKEPRGGNDLKKTSEDGSHREGTGIMKGPSHSRGKQAEEGGAGRDGSRPRSAPG